MKMVKSLLLGTAAGLVAVAGAQAADMPVKAAAVQYVKICSLYGDGFYYIPGTDTCLKMGGYARFQTEYNGGSGGVPVGDSAGEAGQGLFTRDFTNDFNYRARGAISWDIRQQTEYGTLRTYIRFGANNTTPANTGAGTTFTPFWDRAFLQFAGFTVGRSQSFFDLFTYGGGMSYHNVRVSGDTGASGQNLWAYTAQFGNGFTGTLSLEDPATRIAGTVDVADGGFFHLTGPGTGMITADNAFNEQGAALNGFRAPNVIANLRVDQAWGFAGISGALHDASGAYYNDPFRGANDVRNGHPADKLGWAVAGGTLWNLGGGDQFGFNVCYAEGAVGFCANNNFFQLYNSNTSVGLGWMANGVFDTGTNVELTQVWSALAGYQHIWNPHWRTAIGGGYVSINYSDAAKNMIVSHMANSLAACGVAPRGVTFTAITPLAGNSCSPDWAYWEAYTRTQWNPVAQLDIGLELLYSHRDTAFKGAGIVPQNASRPAVFALDDQDAWTVMMRWQRNFYP